MNRTISYLTDDEGMVISRVGSEVAWPILEYDRMRPENNFETVYYLEKINVLAVARMLRYFRGTREVPREIKNWHRQFWGFKPI